MKKVERKSLYPDNSGFDFSVSDREKYEEDLSSLQKRLSMEQENLINLSDFHAQGEAWLEKRGKTEQAANLNKFNNIYQRRMLMMCITPLMGGFKPSNILQSVGLYVGMSAVNPDFKNQIAKKYHMAMDKLYGASSKMLANGHLGKRLSPEQKAMEMDRLQAFRNKHIRAANDGRIPFSPESAAAVDLSLSTLAYRQMREKRNDRAAMEEVFQQYIEARDTLYELAAKDGISESEIAENARLIVGRGLTYHEEFGNCYAETSTKDVVKSDFHLARVTVYNANGEAIGKATERVWTGEFQTKDGKPYTDSFSPRIPFSDKEFANVNQTQLGKFTMENDLDIREMKSLFGVSASIIGKLNSGQSLSEIESNVPLLFLEKNGGSEFYKTMTRSMYYYNLDSQGEANGMEKMKQMLEKNCEAVFDKWIKAKGPEYQHEKEEWERFKQSRSAPPKSEPEPEVRDAEYWTPEPESAVDVTPNNSAKEGTVNSEYDGFEFDDEMKEVLEAIRRQKEGEDERENKQESMDEYYANVIAKIEDRFSGSNNALSLRGEENQHSKY